ncbi:hypothetical protein [Psychromonas antarctica]|nr:hypothetical protein [Psychromonas antarctica]
MITKNDRVFVRSDHKKMQFVAVEANNEGFNRKKNINIASQDTN